MSRTILIRDLGEEDFRDLQHAKVESGAKNWRDFFLTAIQQQQP